MRNLASPLEYYHFIRADEASLLAFLAKWCGDCHFLLPSFPAIEELFEGRVRFAFLDVDELSEMARFHGVNGVPSFILFRSGREVFRLVNPMRKTMEEVIDFLERGLTLRPF